MAASDRALYQATVPYDAETRAQWRNMVVPRAEYDERLTRVRNEMQAMGLDGLLVGNSGDPSGVAYLANYNRGSGTTNLLIPLEREPIAFSDYLLHGEPMHSTLADISFDDLRPASPYGEAPGNVAQLVAQAVRELGLDQATIGLASPRTLSSGQLDQLRSELPGVRWADGTLALTKPRAIKSAREIALMRRAAEMTGVALLAAQDAIRPGVTERDVATAAHVAMFAAGAEGLAFDTAVSSGPRAGLKHGAPTDRTMDEGDLVFLDMGALWGGYHADVSRCAGVGSISNDKQDFLDAAKRMFEAALDAVKPGNTLSAVYRAAQQMAEETGYLNDYQANGLGHGLGLSLFELPIVTPDSPQFLSDENILKPGMIFALEPMLVRYGYGTAVVEETVLVTEDGAETLSGIPW